MNRFIRLRLLAMTIVSAFLLTIYFRLRIFFAKKKMNPLSIPRSRFLFLKPPEKKLLAHRL